MDYRRSEIRKCLLFFFVTGSFSFSIVVLHAISYSPSFPVARKSYDICFRLYSNGNRCSIINCLCRVDH
jgi:hypothetical protein